MLKFKNSVDTQKAEVKTVAGKKRKMKKVAIGTVAFATLGTSIFANYEIKDYFTEKLDNVKSMVGTFANNKAEEIAGLQNELGTMTEAYNKVNGNLTEANSKIAQHEATIEDLNSQIETKDETITELNAEIEALRQTAGEEATTHAQEIARLQGQIDELTQDKEDLTAQVEELTVEVQGIENAVNCLKDNIDYVEGMTPEQIAQAAEQKIEELRGQLEEAGTKAEEDEAYIQYLEGLVNGANDKAEEVEQYVSEVTGIPIVSLYETTLANATKLGTSFGTKILNAEDADYKIDNYTVNTFLIHYEATNKDITVWNYKTGEQVYHMNAETWYNENGWEIEGYYITSSGIVVNQADSANSVTVNFSDFLN